MIRYKNMAFFVKVLISYEPTYRFELLEVIARTPVERKNIFDIIKC